MQLKTGPAFETTSHFTEPAGGWIKKILPLCFVLPRVRDPAGTHLQPLPPRTTEHIFHANKEKTPLLNTCLWSAFVWTPNLYLFIFRQITTLVSPFSRSAAMPD